MKNKPKNLRAGAGKRAAKPVLMGCGHPVQCLGMAADDKGCGWCGDNIDMGTILDHLSRTYDHFSRGVISKPLTHPEEVFAIANDRFSDDLSEAVKEETEELAADVEERNQTIEGLRAELHTEKSLTQRQVEYHVKNMRLMDALSHALERANKDIASWVREFNMYRGAWLREIGGTIVRKTHEIDGFVLRTREIFEAAKERDAADKVLAEYVERSRNIIQGSLGKRDMAGNVWLTEAEATELMRDVGDGQAVDVPRTGICSQAALSAPRALAAEAPQTMEQLDDKFQNRRGGPRQG